eukprot:SAG31_NODE_564_length_14059_cov_5.728940_12_plen_93_part_00
MDGVTRSGVVHWHTTVLVRRLQLLRASRLQHQPQTSALVFLLGAADWTARFQDESEQWDWMAARLQPELICSAGLLGTLPVLTVHDPLAVVR